MNNLLPIGSIVGVAAGVVLAIAGLYIGDRWVAIVGLVAAMFFGVAFAYVVLV